MLQARAGGDQGAAFTAIRRAIGLVPGDPRLRQELIDLDLHFGLEAQAAADAMAAVRDLPGLGAGQWHLLAAGALLRAGHQGPGRMVLELGLAAFPEHPGLRALAVPPVPGAGPLRLNMGCGRDRQPGFVNVDHSEVCQPDQVADLEATPWPWPDDSVGEVLFKHCLEHLGATSQGFLAIIRELYRVCRPDALVRIVVPHPRHDNFLNDPTHVRVVTPEVMGLFSRKNNDEWARAGASNTPLAHQLGVDFEMTACTIELEEPYRTRLREGAMTQEQVAEALRACNNVASEFRMEFRVRKGGR
jgi:SAM-dependent methyltransferase